MDDTGRIAALNNNYEGISFNFGPTLTRWLRRHDPLTLEHVIEADGRSGARWKGHGNAIAQAYNHVILPLADRRDRVTQIRWGLAAFEHDFGRRGEAMWLPETAASHAVLDDLIDHGLRFVVLAPHQAGRVRQPGGPWSDVSNGTVDTSCAYRYLHRDGSGRALAVFFYDAPLAQAIAFGDALRESRNLVEACRAAAGRRKGGGLVHAAFDGETAGHHHPWGDRALAHALHASLAADGFRLTNYADYLDHHPPVLEVELDPGPRSEGTSWSCAHGVGRWIRDCGCRVAADRGWRQAWRTPLRSALDLLRDRSRLFFEEEARPLLGDPWVARDDVIHLLLAPGEESRQRFLARHGRGTLSREQGVRALALLDLQRHVMLSYTSCGWFFDDIGGRESVQVLRYASYAFHRWSELGGTPPLAEFREVLAGASSNVASRGTGADIFDRIAGRDRIALPGIAAHVLIRAAVRKTHGEGSLATQRYQVTDLQVQDSGSSSLASAWIRLEDERTGRRFESAAALLRDGNASLRGGLGTTMDRRAFLEARRQLENAPAVERQARLLALLKEHPFTLASLLASGGRELLACLFQEELNALKEDLGRLCDNHGTLIREARGLGIDVPPGLAGALACCATQRALDQVTAAGNDREARLILREARAGLRMGPGRAGLAWLRVELETALAELLLDWKPSSLPPESWAARGREALRLLDAGRRLRLGAGLPRAQESYAVNFPAASAAMELSPEDRSLAREVGHRLGFSASWLAARFGGGVKAPLQGKHS